jgi:hypothetical protein
MKKLVEVQFEQNFQKFKEKLFPRNNQIPQEKLPRAERRNKSSFSWFANNLRSA